jgi:hypothetical protein
MRALPEGDTLINVGARKTPSAAVPLLDTDTVLDIGGDTAIVGTTRYSTSMEVTVFALRAVSRRRWTKGIFASSTLHL